MSLLSEIEKERGPFPEKYPETTERAMFEAGAFWATERAVRIVERLYPDFSLDGYAYIRAERVVKQIKGEA